MRLIGEAQVSRLMGIASLLTAAAGLLLYGWVSGFRLSWIASPLGLGFTVGALARLAASLVGLLFTGPTAQRVGALFGNCGPR